MLHVKNVKHSSAFKLWIDFDDGSSGEVDLENKLSGPILTPLKDISMFSQVSVDPELETII